jgi:hypothetical protein
MLELLRLLRANDCKTCIVTGGGLDFARMGSEKVYEIPPEQVVGTASATKYEYDKDGHKRESVASHAVRLRLKARDHLNECRFADTVARSNC